MEKGMENVRDYIDKYTLSESQKNIWNLERFYPGESMNNICMSVRIRGVFSAEKLRRTLNLLLESDPALRTRIFFDENNEPVQYEAPYHAESFPVLDFENRSSADISQWEQSVAAAPMNLTGAPLYEFAIVRVNGIEGNVLVKLHHLIADGWSMLSLVNRMARFYDTLIHNGEPETELLPSYRTHVVDEARYMESAAYRADRAFWEKRLRASGNERDKRALTGTALERAGRRLSFEIPEILGHSVKRFLEQERLSLFPVFYAAFDICLRRLGNGNGARFGTPVHNRRSRADKKATGMFVSTIPVLGELDIDADFRGVCAAFADEWFEILRHQRFPYAGILELSRAEGAGEQGLFEVVLSAQDTPEYISQDFGVRFSGKWLYPGSQAEELCIHIGDPGGGRPITVDYDYLISRYSEREIAKLHRMVITFLSDAVRHPGRPAAVSRITRADESQKVTYDFNRTEAPIYPGTPGQRLEEIFETLPERTAVIWERRRYSYAELRTDAERVAGALSRIGNGKKGVTAIFLPKSYELYAALTGVMLSGNAWTTIPVNLPMGRVREILEDCGAFAVITDSRGLTGILPEMVPSLDIHSVLKDNEGIFKREEASLGKSDEPAYYIYTSGSTGHPKGIVIEKRSLMNLMGIMAPFYGHGSVLSLCGTGFDAFLLESAAALLNGRTIAIPGESDTENPACLAKWIREWNVGFISLTPSRLMAYLENDAFRGAAGLLETIVCGGEPFPETLLRRLLECTKADIYNQYGPSETTVAVSAGRLNDTGRITAGRPLANCRCYVLDERKEPLPVGVFGELYIGGACVGRGYHNNSGLTEKLFGDSPFENKERLYRAGDFAAWTEDGELLIGGRIDSQIKLRGQRIDPGEIEERLMSFAGIRQAVVTPDKRGGHEVLAAYYAADEEIPEAGLKRWLAEYLPNYMIPAAFTRLETIPLTDNGKVDFRRLPNQETLLSSGTPDDVSRPGDAKTLLVLSAFRKALKKPDLLAEDDYFLAGGDSLNAMEALAAIEEASGTRLKVADIYHYPTAAGLAALLPERAAEASISDNQEKTTDFSGGLYALSPARLGIYFECAMAPEALAYNMPFAISVRGDLDSGRLQAAIARLVETDPLLRSAFVRTERGIQQKVEENVTVPFTELEADTIEEAKKLFLKPFRLDQAPLFRAAVWRGALENTIFIDTHHLIGDAVTASVLFERLRAFYNGDNVKPAARTFFDYVRWEDSHFSELSARDKAYWSERLAGLPLGGKLPSDYPAEKRFDYLGGELESCLDEELCRKCDAYREKEGLTPFVFFAGAIGIFLGKLTGEKDFCIGAPVSLRRDPAYQETTGLFINTLPLRLFPEDDSGIRDYFRRAREDMADLLDHPYLSTAELAELTGRDQEHSLYRVMVSFRPIEIDRYKFAGMKIRQEPLPTGSAKLGLNFEVFRQEDRYHIRLEYASSFYEEETAAFYLRSLAALLEAAVSGEDGRLGALGALTDEDRERIYYERCRSAVPFDTRTVQEQFDEAARRSPDAPAVIYHENTVTYGELAEASDALAEKLRRIGTGPGDVVGVLCRRSPEALCAELAILKAGAAYAPMLSDFPMNRLKDMIETADIRLVITDHSTIASLAAGLPSAIFVTPDIGGLLMEGSKEENGRSREAGDTCCVLFTSGSTGRPKGVMLRHRGFSNYIAALRPLMTEDHGPVLCATNCVFDVFSTETLAALTYGRAVVMADEEEMMLSWKAAALIQRYHVSAVQFTPTRTSLFLENEQFKEAMSNLPLFLICGEKLEMGLRDKLRGTGIRRIVNLYGPTEATVYASMADVTYQKRITIGKAFPNCRGYVLDEKGREVFPTAVGELFLAGECLAAGYIGRPDLTGSAFTEDILRQGEKMYRTGDLVRRLPNGELEYIGRRDHQVKLNGQRVELTEITEKIMETGLAVQAATIAVKQENYLALRGFVKTRNPADDPELIMEHLKAELPSYMVPSALYAVEDFPRTASGKIDLKQLEKIDLKRFENRGAEGTPSEEKPLEDQTTKPTVNREPINQEPVIQEPEKPCQDVRENILEIWKNTLRIDRIDPTVSFFKQGGNSFAALSVLSDYFNEGYTMSLSYFYDHPTVQEQAEALGAFRSAEKEPTPETRSVTDEKWISGEKSESATVGKTVFLTGATGFFGSHLLKELLEKGFTRVYCLARGDEERLFSILGEYFGEEWVTGNRGMIRAVQGDVLLPDFGLGAVTLERVTKEISILIHAAADVRHYASDDLGERTNIEGTRNAAALAKRSGAKLIYISTVSIGGDYIRESPESDEVFFEDDFDIGQNWEDNVYTRAKFRAERIVREAAEAGMPAMILRLGRLVGRSSDGIFQRNPDTNAFCQIVRALAGMKVVSEELAALPIELTAVDECARAAALLTEADGFTYHVFNPCMVTVGTIAEKLGVPWKHTDQESFEEYLKAESASGDKKTLAPFLAAYTRLKQVPARIRPDCARSERALKKLGFHWSDPDPAILLSHFMEPGKERAR